MESCSVLDMISRDEAIGSAVGRIRGERSQQWVADQMRERGHKWAQATVWNVESGRRPLRLSEAETLADVLGANVDVFMKDEHQLLLQSTMREVHEAWQRLAAIAESFYRKQFTLALTADNAEVPGEYQEDIQRLLTKTAGAICEEAADARATLPEDYEGGYGLMLRDSYGGQALDMTSPDELLDEPPRMNPATMHPLTGEHNV